MKPIKLTKATLKKLDFTVGFEIEFCAPYCYSQEILDSKDKIEKFGLVKSDGSVIRGLEFNSHVMKASDFRQEATWADLFDLFKSLKCSIIGQGTPGMHVHIQRDIFTTDQIYSLNLLLVHAMQFMEKIAGREANHFCPYYTNSKEQISGVYGATKYMALNVCHQNTLEFRIFKSPMSNMVFLNNVQLVVSLADFILLSNIEITNAEQAKDALKHYVKFVMGNYKYYPELNIILKKEKQDAVVEPTKYLMRAERPKNITEMEWLNLGDCILAALRYPAKISIEQMTNVSKNLRAKFHLKTYVSRLVAKCWQEGKTIIEWVR